MVLSREEVEKLLAPLESMLDKAFDDGDYEKVSTGYSEDAAFVHLGNSVVRGRKAIAQAFSKFNGLDATTMTNEKTHAFDINDGEYLMRKGRYRFADGPWMRYMQLFHRQADGSYLIVHDEFELKQ
ncbi:unnamed protein product [Bursaphelenchus xylophilus]|uniref:(pine wood nematode) hypothetical protein n=1 Tax=Bursaphelenchus xylophilus TaxID=6326 RepID=A0A1I7RZD2_BURXY|nr:unnamed protein product [Bursaphelenchus xylophilus]CAG9106572.1 unnamed protein product [Bursaphelenchus xylophilus]